MTSSFPSGVKLHESNRHDLGQIKQLRALVACGEGKTLEFKRKAAYPEKIIREMIAFANTAGGILLVGIADDGGIPGLKYPEEESYVIREALKKIKPSLNATETFIPIGASRTVLQYTIAESNRKPHYFSGADQSRSYFVRVEDKSIQASREVREIIKRAQRQRDIRFHYGDAEKFLMQYLAEKKSITLKEFVAATGLKRFYASNKLILLVLANVLRIIPHERGDLYTLAFGKF